MLNVPLWILRKLILMVVFFVCVFYDELFTDSGFEFEISSTCLCSTPLKKWRVIEFTMMTCLIGTALASPLRYYFAAFDLDSKTIW
jgi:hypothetical protein